MLQLEEVKIEMTINRPTIHDLRYDIVDLQKQIRVQSFELKWDNPDDERAAELQRGIEEANDTMLQMIQTLKEREAKSVRIEY